MSNDLVQACRLVTSIDEALDRVYDEIDAKFVAGQFEDVNRFLLMLRVQDVHTDILLGILTATLPAKSKLASRDAFMARTEAVIRERNEWEEGLGKGLE